jgi:hypothetical protein
MNYSLLVTITSRSNFDTESLLDPPTEQPVVSRYTDWATRTTDCGVRVLKIKPLHTVMYLQDIYWLPDNFVSHLMRPFSEQEWVYGLFNDPVGSLNVVSTN